MSLRLATVALNQLTHFKEEGMTDSKTETKAEVMAYLRNDLHEYQDGRLSIGVICQKIADWHDSYASDKDKRIVDLEAEIKRMKDEKR